MNSVTPQQLAEWASTFEFINGKLTLKMTKRDILIRKVLRYFYKCKELSEKKDFSPTFTAKKMNVNKSLMKSALNLGYFTKLPGYLKYKCNVKIFTQEHARQCIEIINKDNMRRKLKRHEHSI